MKWLNGRKSYLVSFAMLAFAVLGFALGKLDATQAGELLLQVLAIAGLRHGIQKLQIPWRDKCYK